MHQVSGAADDAKTFYEIVPADQLPPGRACRITEVPGHATVSIAKGHGTEDLCAQLDEYHRQILGQARWAQTAPASSERIEQPAEGLAMASASWRLVAACQLPPGVLCLPLEGPGTFTWLIHEDHASEQLCAEMNEYLARIVGDGLWRQRWPESD